jgi:hypothetical protein
MSSSCLGYVVTSGVLLRLWTDGLIPVFTVMYDYHENNSWCVRLVRWSSSQCNLCPALHVIRKVEHGDVLVTGSIKGPLCWLRVSWSFSNPSLYCSSSWHVSCHLLCHILRWLKRSASSCLCVHFSPEMLVVTDRPPLFLLFPQCKTVIFGLIFIRSWGSSVSIVTKLRTGRRVRFP